MDFIGAIENAIGKTAKKEMLPMQPGDVSATYACIEDLISAVDYHPQPPVQGGINDFITWSTWSTCIHLERSLWIVKARKW